MCTSQIRNIVTCLIILSNIPSADGSQDNAKNVAMVCFSNSQSANSLPSTRSSSTLVDHGVYRVSVLSVYISNNGKNTPDCIYGGTGSPCQTIQHAYDQMILQITNATHFVKFVFMDEVYNMTGMFFINKQAHMLTGIEFTSMFRTNITTVDEEAVFWIGCNSSDKDPCISYSIEFNNLKFEGFGSKFAAVLVVFNIKLLSLTDCIFSQNSRSAINALETSVVLANIDFKDNIGSLNFREKDANLTLGFPMSNASTGGAVAFVFREGRSKFVNVSQCSFTGNKAAMNLLLPYVEHSLTDSQFPRVGGGVLVLFMGNCSDVNVTFVNSNFTRNSAFAGGAVVILADDHSKRNNVRFTKCIFLHNIVTSTAGAILFVTWDYGEKNALTIADCKLCSNRAKYAGAIKYIISRIMLKGLMESNATGMEIIRSQFCHNIAQTGSAIHTITDAYIIRQTVSPVKIIDSLFIYHDLTGSNVGEKSVSQFGGTILTHNIDLMFIGHNSVEKNKVGCGLFASNANIHVNGTLNFSQNVAVATGGGMTLADTSHLILYPGSHLRFVENEAGTQGGALAVFTIGMPQITHVYNPLCFLQYIIPNQPHSKWNAKVEFIRNRARLKGGAIYINTMTACLWTEYYPHRSFKRALRWNDNFVYINNSVGETYDNVLDSWNGSHGDADIVTDTNELVLQSPKEVTLAPGEAMPFRLSGLDEMKREIRSTATGYPRAYLRNGTQAWNTLLLPNKYFILDPDETTLSHLMYEVDASNYKGITDKKFEHQIEFFESYSSFVVKTTLNVTPVYCLPGFVYDGKSSCRCNSGVHYIQRCNGTKITLTTGLWGTSINGKLATYQCPPNYCKCTQYAHPGECVYDSIDSDSQCSKNRQGVLCGACKGRKNNLDYGLSLYSGECIECDSHSMSVAKGGLACLVGGVLIVAILVVYLNPSFSTKMRGPAFYVQVLPYSYSGRSFMGNIIRYAAAVLTLGGSSHLPIPGCLSPDWSTLHITALTYVSAAVILLVLLAIYIMSHYLVLHFERDSPFESFWILLIVVYFVFSTVSLKFLHCVNINGKQVFFYDGSVECFIGEHLVMVIISSIILILFVILPPLAVMLICMGRTNAPVQVVDVLTKGLRYPYRWWWACDLSRRFAFVAVSVFVSQRDMKKVLFLVLSNFFLTVHAFCQPYKDAFANVSETLLLLSMSTIAALHLTNEGLAEDVATIIIALTFVYVCILSLCLLVRFIERRYNRNIGCVFHQSCIKRIHASNGLSIPDRVEDF